MIQSGPSANKTRRSRGRDLRRLVPGLFVPGFFVPWVFAACGLVAAVPARAQSAPATTIVEPSRNPKPDYSKDRQPSAQQLIETWRSSNQLMPGKRVDLERFEIRDRRVVWRKYGRAFLQFRILSPDGDATAWAREHCPGRSRPVEIQVFYQFSSDIGAWVPHHTRGDSSESLCSDTELWTADQVTRLVDPPPLPVPPEVSMRDVITPPVTSPERAAIIDALRPRYEELFGKPIVFKVLTLRVAAGFAYTVVHPQRPNGSPIELSVWNKAFGEGCFQDRTSVVHQYWLKKDGGAWTIGGKNGMCADDSIADEGDLIGAPPQLAEKNAWPEREFMPEPD